MAWAVGASSPVWRLVEAQRCRRWWLTVTRERYVFLPRFLWIHPGSWKSTILYICKGFMINIPGGWFGMFFSINMYVFGEDLPWRFQVTQSKEAWKIEAEGWKTWDTFFFLNYKTTISHFLMGKFGAPFPHFETQAFPMKRLNKLIGSVNLNLLRMAEACPRYWTKMVAIFEKNRRGNSEPTPQSCGKTWKNRVSTQKSS